MIWWAKEDSNLRPRLYSIDIKMVGTDGIEPSTSSLSETRSTTEPRAHNFSTIAAVYFSQSEMLPVPTELSAQILRILAFNLNPSKIRLSTLTPAISDAILRTDEIFSQ